MVRWCGLATVGENQHSSDTERAQACSWRRTKKSNPFINKDLRFLQNGGGGGDRTQFREIATPRRKAAQSTRSQCRIRRYRAQSKTANRSLTQFPCTRITLLRTICVQHACNRSTACLRTLRLSSRPGRPGRTSPASHPGNRAESLISSSEGLLEQDHPCDCALNAGGRRQMPFYEELFLFGNRTLLIATEDWTKCCVKFPGSVELSCHPYRRVGASLDDTGLEIGILS